MIAAPYFLDFWLLFDLTDFYDLDEVGKITNYSTI